MQPEAIWVQAGPLRAAGTDLNLGGEQFNSADQMGNTPCREGRSVQIQRQKNTVAVTMWEELDLVSSFIFVTAQKKGWKYTYFYVLTSPADLVCLFVCLFLWGE